MGEDVPADAIREALNTVGKRGRLGAGVRCVISVSMLTEGWDARTVHQIVGFRAFSSQLLCEQVTGRALRRTAYDAFRDEPDKTHSLTPEYAEVLGIPFEFMPLRGTRVGPTTPNERRQPACAAPRRSPTCSPGQTTRRSDSGSLFVQIGDINVHRLALVLVLDEVFGPENRLATITWRPTAGSSARTLPESASYLLWYANDKARCKYRQPYESLDLARVIAEWDRSFSAPRVQDEDGSTRSLTSDEKQSPRWLVPRGGVRLLGVEGVQARGVNTRLDPGGPEHGPGLGHPRDCTVCEGR